MIRFIPRAEARTRGKVMAFRPLDARALPAAASASRAIRMANLRYARNINYPNVLSCEQSITENDLQKYPI